MNTYNMHEYTLYMNTRIINEFKYKIISNDKITGGADSVFSTS